MAEIVSTFGVGFGVSVASVGLVFFDFGITLGPLAGNSEDRSKTSLTSVFGRLARHANGLGSLSGGTLDPLASSSFKNPYLLSRYFSRFLVYSSGYFSNQ